MKLTIYAGKVFSADFTVVSNDGITPEDLAIGDTAVFTLSTNGSNPRQIICDHAMTLIDVPNGLFNLTLTVDETEGLTQDIGFQEDRYKPLSNYIGYIDFKLASGDRQAMVDMFVKEVGEPCPVAP